MEINIELNDEDGKVQISRKACDAPTWVDYLGLFLDALRGKGYVFDDETISMFNKIEVYQEEKLNSYFDKNSDDDESDDETDDDETDGDETDGDEVNDDETDGDEVNDDDYESLNKVHFHFPKEK
jgi:hypothetical protein